MTRALLQAVSPMNLEQFNASRSGATERLARFYAEYVGHKDQTYDESQDCHPNLPHIRLTPFRKGVANRRFCNSAKIILSSRADICQTLPPLNEAAFLMPVRMYLR